MSKRSDTPRGEECGVCERHLPTRSGPCNDPLCPLLLSPATHSEDSADATARMLPCPSCGETDVDATFATGTKGGEREERFYNAGCMVCGMTGPDSHTPRDAADRWNALPRKAFATSENAAARELALAIGESGEPALSQDDVELIRKALLAYAPSETPRIVAREMTEEEIKAFTEMRPGQITLVPSVNEAMRLALERADGCIRGLIAKTPVRDVSETLAEIESALRSAPSAIRESVTVPRNLAERTEAMFRSVDPQGSIAQEWRTYVE